MILYTFIHEVEFLTTVVWSAIFWDLRWIFWKRK